jgi:uncharacterized membrane protein YfcA
MDIGYVVYTSIVIILAFGGEALFGFGGGLVAVPLLSLILKVGDAVVLVAIFQFLFGFLAIRNYRSVAWLLMPPLLVGMLVGVWVGVSVLSRISEPVLEGLLALTIVSFLMRSLLFSQLGATSPSWIMGTCAGIASGFFQGCLGMGGPPIVMYLKRIIPEPLVFRASMIFCLSVINIIRIPLVGYRELVTQEVGVLFLSVCPAFLFATWFGQRYHERVPQGIYFRVVHLLLGLTAVVLLLRAVGLYVP